MMFAGRVLPGNDFDFIEVRAGVHIFHKYNYLFIVNSRDPDRYAYRCAASDFACVVFNVEVGGARPWWAEGRFSVHILLVLDLEPCCV